MRRRLAACIAGLLLFTVAPALGATRTVHVFVALADNLHQGIVPVARALGNGDDPDRNLYWGSAYGVRTFFANSRDWKLLSKQPHPKSAVLERCIFMHSSEDVYLVADAYRGSEIQQAILDFFDAAGANFPEDIPVESIGATIHAGGGADLVAYIGHDGLMDFTLPRMARDHTRGRRPVIILACASQIYFAQALRAAGAYPLLWTTNLMAPEAYTLKSALDGWMAGEQDQQIRERAAVAYDHYQKCGILGARKLFATGWR
jgi:hypothetical protein